MENIQDIDMDELFAKLCGSTTENVLKRRISMLEKEIQEQSHLTVRLSELRETLKKKNAEHQLVVDNLRAEITELLKCQKQQKQLLLTAPASELPESEKPSHSVTQDTDANCYQIVQLLQALLLFESSMGSLNDTNLKEQISELERKIEEQSPLANQIAELQRKVEEQSNLATKVTELEGKIEQQSDMEGRILKLERRSQKNNNSGAKVSELEQKVGELSHLTTRVSNLERKSVARNTVNELSLSQLSEMIDALQLNSERQSQQIHDVGKQCKIVPRILCFYHNKFGANSLKCQEPCDYNK